MRKKPDSAGTNAARQLRCAIYTRKSSEEGLEQDFNSLDAQREACAAYILSQKHAGWIALPAMYDDGGVSGGTIQRPALQRLVSDIRGGKVQVVVVYKVDRLTRSLADFAKLVETFDAHEVSFVSVTQQFNTTSSMGRLTLNVLLSFAQFEREVTGERIRDKIAASKKKGMWMGGLTPLGYDTMDRKLVINEAEAKTVRHIFKRYADLGSVRLLKLELDADGILSKTRQGEAGRRWGGRPIPRGALYRLLQNRIYRGEIVHKGPSYPGEHPAIIDAALWETVQRRLALNRAERATGVGASEPSLLAGILHDEYGPMTPTHAVKGGRRYRYYVSRPLVTADRSAAPDGRRVPAGEIESLVAERLLAFFADAAEVQRAIEPFVTNVADQRRLLVRAGALAQAWDGLPASERKDMLGRLGVRVDLHPDRIDIQFVQSRITSLLRVDTPRSDASDADNKDQRRLTLSIRARLRRAGLGAKMIVRGRPTGEPNPALIRLLARAHALGETLRASDGASLRDIARSAAMSGSHAARLIRLTFLAPDIVRDIVDGRHPPTLNAARLLKDGQLPLDWKEQRRALGFERT